jgi:hypothetical protein
MTLDPEVFVRLRGKIPSTPKSAGRADKALIGGSERYGYGLPGTALIAESDENHINAEDGTRRLARHEEERHPDKNKAERSRNYLLVLHLNREGGISARVKI